MSYGNRAPNDFSGRFHVASNVELTAALNAVNDSVEGITADVGKQIEAALRLLAPESLTIVCSLARGTKQQPFKIGNGEVSILRKLTLVRIAPGSFPSSVVWQHDDVSGSFILDSNQQTIDIGQIQYGERTLLLTNNDAGVDCAVLVVCDRMPV